MPDNHKNIDLKKSKALLAEAKKVIPLGSQTFSKSYLSWPSDIAPLFASHGKGSKITDVDGNEYIDFSNSLLSISLGYCDEDVNRAVEAQLAKGSIFSLNSPLETEVAQMIIETVPCAEQVRFGKNGSDATAGAIRAARSYTGKNRIAVCGYHGWQDWYIGSTTRNKGVPEATRQLTHIFTYNDAASLKELFEAYKGEFAAIILEPMNIDWPENHFLETVTDMARENGALVIFDETITGFRFATGGAQALFDVVPDLATFGKGFANGFPLSAVTGKTDIMREFEDVFFSFTMGGETLSLAAAKAAITKIKNKNVPQHLERLGEVIIEGTKKLIKQNELDNYLEVKGHPSWSFIIFKDHGDVTQWDIKTLWQQEVIKRGILCQGTHNLSFAHNDADIDHLLQVYEEVFSFLSDRIKANDVRAHLNCAPLESLFKVR